MGSLDLLIQDNIYIKTQSNQPTVGFLRLLSPWNGRIVGLVCSTIELRTPSQDLTWPPQLLHHPTQGSIPFTATQFPQAIPSLLVFFRVRRKDFSTLLGPFVRFLSSLGLSSQFWASSTPNQFKPTKGFIEQQHTSAGYEQNVPGSQK